MGVVGAEAAAAANPGLCLQDEREVKRQRRKQSNRESARRSRLRKQAECDDLGTRATKLVDENESLRAENHKFKMMIAQLLAEKQAVVDQVRVARRSSLV
jgi:plant G-box-binding factor